MSWTTPLAYEAKEDRLKEEIQAAALKPGSPLVFYAGFHHPAFGSIPPGETCTVCRITGNLVFDDDCKIRYTMKTKGEI